MAPYSKAMLVPTMIDSWPPHSRCVRPHAATNASWVQGNAIAAKGIEHV